MSDPIANMLIAIKNGSVKGKATIIVPYSNLKNNILACLKKEGYIASFSKKNKKGHPYIEIALLYENTQPKVRSIERISKQSKRVYAGVKDIHSVLGGKGLLVLSTPKGIMSGKEARKEHAGGEVLFKVW